MKIIIHDEMPQWIRSSDKGAYQPAAKTIHLARYLGNGRRVGNLEMAHTFLHEVCHWFICEAGLDEKWHRWLDGKNDDEEVLI